MEIQEDAQLVTRMCGLEIMHGGDNEAIMGAFDHLYQPQPIENLEASLEEYLRFGLDSAVLLIDTAYNARRKL